MRHKIQPNERGHRAPLSENEPTKQYSIKVTQSLKQKMIALGPTKVREILEYGTSCAKKTGRKKDE